MKALSTQVHESVVIVGAVQIGTGTFIAPNVTIFGPCRIGSGNVIGPNAVIGAPPQDDAWSMEAHVSGFEGGAVGCETVIGDNNVIREFVTIHRGTERPTSIGDNNYLMAYAHVAHDCRVGNRCKITNAVQLAGHVTVMDGTYIGLSATVHQFAVIGAASIIGMGSLVARDVPPGAKVVGSPARCVGPNVMALSPIVGVQPVTWWSSFLDKTDEGVPAEAIAMRRDWELVCSQRNEWRARIKQRRSAQLQVLKHGNGGGEGA